MNIIIKHSQQSLNEVLLCELLAAGIHTDEDF